MWYFCKTFVAINHNKVINYLQSNYFNNIMFRLKVQSIFCLCFFVFVGYVSCTKDNESQEGNLKDPDGTVIINVRNDATSYSLQGDNIGALCLSRDNNFYAWGGAGYTGINTIGSVSGLGAITYIPQGIEWASSVAAFPGYGYIINFNGYYARFYVVDWITSVGFDGVIVKYQSPWQPY